MTEHILQFDNRKGMVWALAGLVIATCFLYGYFLEQTVVNTAVRSDIEQKITSLTSGISEREFDYIALKNAVTVDVAYAMGFKDVEHPDFISRRTLGALSLNTVR